MTTPSDPPSPPPPPSPSSDDAPRSLPDWAPHPTLLRAAATSACLLVIAAAGWLVLVVLDQLTLVIFPLVVTLYLTRILAPGAKRLRSRGMHPAAAAGVTLGSALLLVAAFIALIAPPLVDEFSDLGPTLDRGLGEIEDWLVEDSSFDVTRAEIEETKQTIADRSREIIEESQDSIMRGARLTAAGVAGLILALVLTFFALKEGDRFVGWVDGHVPAPRRHEVRAAGDASWRALGGYLRGAALLGVLEAIVIGGAMALVGSGLVIPVMILTFVAAFVPIVGAVVAGVIAVLVTLAAGGLVPALIVGIVAIVVQQLDNDLLAPWIYGKALQLHPVVVLLAITTGSTLFGFAGTVLAVPLTAAVIMSVEAVRTLRDPDREAVTVPDDEAGPRESPGTTP